MKTIPLRKRNGEERARAIVDDGDFEALSDRRWALDKDGYAVGSLLTPTGYRQVFMHRYLLGLAWGDGRQVDHINADRLDNRRGNLRICTPAENSQNRGSKPGSSSRFRNVSFHPRSKSKPWRVDVKVDGKSHYFGYYATEEEAAEVAALARTRLMTHSRDYLEVGA